MTTKKYYAWVEDTKVFNRGLCSHIKKKTLGIALFRSFLSYIPVSSISNSYVGSSTWGKKVSDLGRPSWIFGCKRRAFTFRSFWNDALFLKVLPACMQRLFGLLCIGDGWSWVALLITSWLDFFLTGALPQKRIVCFCFVLFWVSARHDLKRYFPCFLWWRK